MPLSREAAQKIQRWLEAHGGSINDNGLIEVDTVMTTVIEDWIREGAHVFFQRGQLRISNWVQSPVKHFDVYIKGDVSAEDLAQHIRYYQPEPFTPKLCERDVKVKELKDDC